MRTGCNEQKHVMNVAGVMDGANGARLGGGEEPASAIDPDCIS